MRLSMLMVLGRPGFADTSLLPAMPWCSPIQFFDSGFPGLITVRFARQKEVYVLVRSTSLQFGGSQTSLAATLSLEHYCCCSRCTSMYQVHLQCSGQPPKICRSSLPSRHRTGSRPYAFHRHTRALRCLSLRPSGHRRARTDRSYSRDRALSPIHPGTLPG